MQLLIFNEECLVSASHQLALITSLPFVHTARRSYRLNDPVRPPDWGDAFGSPDATLREAVQTLLFRGRRSRNKVSVGEPAEGSLPVSIPNPVRTGFRAAAGPRVGLCVLPPAWSPLRRGAARVGGAWACGRVQELASFGRASCVARRRAVLLRPTPAAGVDSGRLPAPHNPNNNSCRRISWLPQR